MSEEHRQQAEWRRSNEMRKERDELKKEIEKLKKEIDELINTKPLRYFVRTDCKDSCDEIIADKVKTFDKTGITDFFLNDRRIAFVQNVISFTTEEI